MKGQIVWSKWDFVAEICQNNSKLVFLGQFNAMNVFSDDLTTLNSENNEFLIPNQQNGNIFRQNINFNSKNSSEIVKKRIKLIIQLYIPFVNNVPFPGTE